MKLVASGASVVGPRHVDLNEPNQDAIGLNGWRGGWIAAVADGLGSRSHSDIGSKCACQAARNILRGKAKNIELNKALELIHQLWIETISPHAADDAATTLLLASVDNDGVVRAAQLGDGLLLVRTYGEFSCITPARTGYSNQTQALGSEHRPELWVTVETKISKPGDGIVLLTDGIGDDIDPENLPDFVDALYKKLISGSRRRSRRWLESELQDWATPLHNDDKSIVGIFRKY